MGQRLAEVIRDGLLAVGVLCGPGLWLAALACAFTAWQPGIEGAAILELLAASFVFMCWALWGIVSGLWRLRYWWFGFASFLNLVTGAWILEQSLELKVTFIGLLFIVYSLWQALIFSRRFTSRSS